MERSEWSDDEPFAFRQPLPPEDRVWRHPSELGGGAGAAFVASSPAVMLPDELPAGPLAMRLAVVAR